MTITLLLAAAAFAAAPQAPAAAPAEAKPRPGFMKAWEPYWPFSVEVPKGWHLEKSGFQGPHGGAVEDHPLQATKGEAVMDVAILYTGHPEYKDVDSFVAAHGKEEGLEMGPATPVTVGSHKPGKRFEVTDKKKKLKHAYAVIPVFDGLWAFSYSAPAGAFAKHLPAFDHLVSSFKFVTPRSK